MTHGPGQREPKKSVKPGVSPHPPRPPAASPGEQASRTLTHLRAIRAVDPTLLSPVARELLNQADTREFGLADCGAPNTVRIQDTGIGRRQELLCSRHGEVCPPPTERPDLTSPGVDDSLAARTRRRSEAASAAHRRRRELEEIADDAGPSPHDGRPWEA